MDVVTLFFIALIIFVAGFTGLAIYSQIKEYQLKKLKLVHETQSNREEIQNTNK